MAYTQPTAADLKLRFPDFAAVADDTVEYWLTDARLTVTDSWIEADRAPAEMTLAAHNMALNGLGAGGDMAGLAGAGVSSFRSASLSVSFDASAVAAATAGGYGTTRYGIAFRTYLRRNTGGPFLSGCAASSCC
jgi:hypothetical protein